MSEGKKTSFAFRIKSIFTGIADFFINHFRILSSVGYAICIVVIVFVSITFFSRKDSTFGILFSTALSCLLTVPITLNMSQVLKARARSEENKKDRQLKIQQNEIEKLKSQNEITLRKLQLIEDTKFNMPVYQDVAKLTLKEISRSGTIVKKEEVADVKPRNYYERIFGVSERHKDEILSVINYEMNVKSGIDLQNIRVSKISDDTIIVGGITPQYTADPQFNFTDVIGELRHISLDHNGREKHINIEKDFDSETKISQKQNQYKSDAEEEFKTGYSLGEDREIIKAAQNFIRIMLAPLYKNIEFETDAQIIPRNSLPLLSYLQNESMNYKEQLFKTKEGTELLAKYNLLSGDE